MQGAFAQLAQPAGNQLPSRVMFKPHLLAEDTSFDAAFMDRLPTEHQGLRRRLTEASDGQQIQIQSLGQHTGMNMIEVPQGVNISDVLKALQDHPGVLCSTVACSLSHTISLGHATLLFTCGAQILTRFYMQALAAQSSVLLLTCLAPHQQTPSARLPGQGSAHSLIHPQQRTRGSPEAT